MNPPVATLEQERRMVRPGGVLAALFRRREAGIFLALIALIVLIAIFRPQFLGSRNLYMVSRQVAYTAIVALGVFFVILTGGIDLSIGAVVSLSGVICALLLVNGVHPALAVAGGLGTGALIGAINGAMVSHVGIAPFIVTLGMMGVVRGAVLVITGGNTVENIPESFLRFCSWDRLGPPMVVLVLAGIAVVSHVILAWTVFGRRVYAVGGNEAATALSGINTRTVKLLTYLIAGVLSSVTGVLYIGRFNSAQAAAGTGMEMDAIAAAVIGGTSLMGGEGTVAGVLIGATIMGVIRSGLVQMDISPYWQELIIGTIIVLAAVLDVIRNRRR